MSVTTAIYEILSAIPTITLRKVGQSIIGQGLSLLADMATEEVAARLGLSGRLVFALQVMGGLDWKDFKRIGKFFDDAAEKLFKECTGVSTTARVPSESVCKWSPRKSLLQRTFLPGDSTTLRSKMQDLAGVNPPGWMVDPQAHHIVPLNQFPDLADIRDKMALAGAPSDNPLNGVFLSSMFHQYFTKKPEYGQVVRDTLKGCTDRPCFIDGLNEISEWPANMKKAAVDGGYFP